MRTMLLLVAMLALGASSASSQDACIKAYQPCVAACGNQPSKSALSNCIGMCERKNDACSEASWGPRQQMIVTPQASAAPQQAPAAARAAVPQQAPAREQAAVAPQAPQKDVKAELRNGVRVEVDDDGKPAQK